MSNSEVTIKLLQKSIIIRKKSEFLENQRERDREGEKHENSTNNSASIN